jgi:hypothetical protein
MIRHGGNGQIRDFFKKLKIENSPINVLYTTKAASLYRERLKTKVEKILSGEVVADSPKTLSSSHSMEQMHPATTSPKTEKLFTYECEFDKGPMGITLTKDFRGEACISKLVPGGAGAKKGVQLNDVVVGVMGKNIEDYDEVMHMILCMERPIRLTFKRIAKPPSPRTPNESPRNSFTAHKPPTNPHTLTTTLATKTESETSPHTARKSPKVHGAGSKPPTPTSTNASTNHRNTPIAMIRNEDDSSDSDVEVQINQILFDAKMAKQRYSKSSSSTRTSPRSSVRSEVSSDAEHGATSAPSDSGSTPHPKTSEHREDKELSEEKAENFDILTMETPRPENVDDVIRAINLAVGSVHVHDIDPELENTSADDMQATSLKDSSTSDEQTTGLAEDYEIINHTQDSGVMVSDASESSVNNTSYSVTEEADEAEVSGSQDDHDDEGSDEEDDEPLTSYIQVPYRGITSVKRQGA